MEILELDQGVMRGFIFGLVHVSILIIGYYSGWSINRLLKLASNGHIAGIIGAVICLLYTSPSPRDGLLSRMPSSA